MKIILLFFTCLVALSTATDYCNKELCKQYNGVSWNYVPHIGCDNSGELSEACPADTVQLDITEEHKKTILHTLNTLRNKIASGSLPRFESAAHMTQVTWDEELAKLALLNANQCEQKHDQCRNTDKYPFADQSLNHQAWSGYNYTDDYNLETLITNWFDENKYSNQKNIDNFGDSLSSKQTNHFTMLVHQKASKVGCGVTKFNQPSNGWKRFQLTCNYSFGNLVGEPIYLKGAPCSGCKSGCSTEYDSLCSTAEKVNFNADAYGK